MHYSRLMLTHKKKELQLKSENRYIIKYSLLMFLVGASLYILGCEAIELYIKYQFLF